jgi:hypothetical protein
MTTLELLRSGLLAILVFAQIGVVLELILLKHTESSLQLIPLALLAAGIAVCIAVVFSHGAAAIHALRATMLLFIAAGALGLVLHYRSNLGYEQESNPSLRGRELYVAAIMGSNPSLAPGTMVQLGLLGLLLTFRHPRLARRPVGFHSP